jgi:hypothetical protein
MKYLEHTLETYVYETSLWNTCNVPLKHLKCMLATCIRIVVRPPPPFASGRHSRSRRRGRRASALGPMLSGKAGRRAEAAAWSSGAAGWSRRRSSAGWPPTAERATEQEQTRWASTRRAERSKSLVLFSFPYRTGATEEMDANTGIKNERAQIRGRRGVRTDMAFPQCSTWSLMLVLYILFLKNVFLNNLITNMYTKNKYLLMTTDYIFTINIFRDINVLR